MSGIIFSPALSCAYMRLLRNHYPSYLQKIFYTLNPTTAFHANWHLQAIGEYLNAMQQGELRRLIINIPPRSLKSIAITVGWSSYLLGHNPACKIITASYSSTISIKHAMDTRSILTSPWYRRIFPELQIMAGQNEKHKLVTTRHGFRLASSVGGSLTGEGGDVIIVDDPQNPRQAASRRIRQRANEWFDHTLISRLNDKQRGIIVVVMQRLHPDDLTGHLLERGGWEQLCLPAMAESSTIIQCGAFRHIMKAGDVLQPLRENAATLQTLKHELGSIAYTAQYLQSPVPESGYMIKREWLIAAEALPTDYPLLVQSWDTAIKTGAGNDYSACVTMGVYGGTYYVLDVLALRADFTELRRLIITHYQHHSPHVVLIEDKASGQSLIQDLRRSSDVPIVAIMPKGDKVQRVAAITPLLESGRVQFIPHAAWGEDFYAELLAFPNGAHDDRVDALTQALHYAQMQQQSTRHNIRTL
jgi:predicted phage terminase large subunit-like protein